MSKYSLDLTPINSDEITTPRRSSLDHTQDVSNTALSATHQNLDPAEVPLPDSPIALDLPDLNKSQEQESKSVTAVPTSDALAPVSPENATSLDLGKDSPGQTASPLAEVPARTASPVPPPVPRRAARRTAPVPPGGSQSPTLSPPADSEAPKAVIADNAEGSNAVDDSEPSRVVVSPLQGDIDIPKPTETASILQDTLTAVQASSTASASSQAESVDHRDASATLDTEDSAGKENGTPPSSRAGEPSPRRPPPLPARPSTDHQRRASNFSDRHESSPRRPSISNANANGEEPEVYIGDATWEERTWKVLVRLREDMFYARLGSVR